ncbi:hypothetical protein F2Q68_00030528 [Brassica cretica]|uniref:Outer envelope pore protein 16-2, chloroplastic n=1 Tax=Brassica cretica TaxID=69181 RepID=A0A8S9GC55_BRACR|nr:hypothetical protein F2Q68_00030528 [Brassica cretica]
MEKSGGRKVMDEIRSFEKASLFDLGHPLLNRVADSFVKAAGVGALQAVSREAYFTVVDGKSPATFLFSVKICQENNRSSENLINDNSGTGFDSSSMGPPSEDTGSKKHRFPNLRGPLTISSTRNYRENSSKSLEALVKNTGKESLQWGLAAGLYSGITYGMKEARGGAHDWRNSAVAGALTGAAMAMTTSERTSHEQVVQSALTGAAISTAANLLSSVF